MKSIFDKLVQRKLYLEIPADEPVSRQRFTLFRIFSIVGALTCFGVSFKMIATIEDCGLLPVFIISLGVIMIFNFYGVRNVNKLQTAYLTMLISAVLLLHIVSYTCGGIRTAGTLYFGVIILYSYMLLGKKAGRWFTGITMVHVTYLFFITSFTDWTSFAFFKNDIFLINEDFLVNALLSFILIAVQGNFLQSNKNEVIQAVEKQKKQLEEKNAVLEHKNELLNTYTVNLERTNAELRKFVSVTSHDLKAPLRAIGSLAGFIEDVESKTLKEESREYLDLLKNRVSRMDKLLNALVEYSTITESSHPNEQVNTEVLISGIIKPFISGPAVQIELKGNFPVISINQKLLAKVFSNLVHNALLFNDKDIKCVLISTHHTDDCFVFSVKDNGPGIDKMFYDKIFIVFQTLKPRDELETMGVGLAVAKKIVENWGGVISVDSQPGTGSIFTFSFPRNTSQIQNRMAVNIENKIC
ncbi:MAG TPA: ATP-binding protein [Bacteroidia bacterium]|nr:ATP-binding protein [Bacteroidia bacterium]